MEEGFVVRAIFNPMIRAAVIFILLGMAGLLSAAETCFLRYVDPMIGTAGEGAEDAGMMPYACVPFGSFFLVPMTRVNCVSQLSFNAADKTLLGFILTRQPCVWMGDWGEVRVPMVPAEIESCDYRPHLGRVVAGGRSFKYVATRHAAWIHGDLREIRLLSGGNANRDDENLGYPLPNFRGWRYVERNGDDLKIGVSLISIEQAKENLAREIGTRTFDAVSESVRQEWESLLGRFRIDAPEDVKTIFYTGLYHALLYPRQIGEYGRRYSAFDDRIHEGDGYTSYSLWDTYRAEHALLTLIVPERVDAMMQSLVDMYREGGWLPKYPNPGYTGIMVGAPAEIVLAQAWAYGFRGFDLQTAYEAVRKNATVPQKGDRTNFWWDRGEFGCTPETRGGLSRYMELGYVACDETVESVSRTQDFAFADRAAAVLADATGHADDARRFRLRAKNYTNVWNRAAQAFHPRRADGAFVAPDCGYNYCEQAVTTATWGVPYDPEGLAALLGGKEAAARRLDRFFDELYFKPEFGHRSVHGNEPGQHCAYLFNRFGHPEMTQRRVREIQTRCYSTSRVGYDGNEDNGQMSAGYILSALGLYPLDQTSGEYEIGSPLVRSATLTFGRPYAPATLKVTVRNYSPDRWRVARALLNGRELVNWRVRHADLVAGGELVFEMEGR